MTIWVSTRSKHIWQGIPLPPLQRECTLLCLAEVLQPFVVRVSHPHSNLTLICSSHAASETIYNSLQGPLLPTQWFTELSAWFTVGLAALQQGPLEYATGPKYLGSTGKLVSPLKNDTIGQRLCHSQTFRNSGEVQSFSLLGISIILGVGGFVILISLCLETVVGWMQRRSATGEARRRQWEQDDKLELLAKEKGGTNAPETRRQRYSYIHKSGSGTDSLTVSTRASQSLPAVRMRQTG